MPLTDTELVQIQESLISLAISAGKIVLSADLSSSETETKKNGMLAPLTTCL
jgi:hypothetical protein